MIESRLRLYSAPSFVFVDLRMLVDRCERKKERKNALINPVTTMGDRSMIR